MQKRGGLIIIGIIVIVIIMIFILAFGFNKKNSVNLETEKIKNQLPVIEKVLNPGLPPSDNFDLTHYYITIPGPEEIYPLTGYTSKYFFTDPNDGSMVFWINSSERGSTPNSEYVRSELRERVSPPSNSINWRIQGTHNLTARVKFRDTGETPTQVTFLQIHGYAPGTDVKPLLRVTLDKRKNVKIYYKTDDTGENTLSVTCPASVYFNAFDIEVLIKDNRLIVTLNGAQCMNQDISYWSHDCYFKAGDYAQSKENVSEIHFYKLDVNHKYCGNGKIEENEICDDFNYNNGDGCSSCLVEEGWECIGQPSACTLLSTPDITPPYINITAPLNNTNVAGTLPINVDAIDK